MLHQLVQLSWIVCCLPLLCAQRSINAQDADSLKQQSSVLSDTGQTERYTQTFGEDADFAGHGPSYLDNGDGTVTDRVSGLMWQKTDGGDVTWEKAKEYAATLELGGHTDWRLPNSMELFSIMDHSRHGPAMDSEVFPKTAARYWWTSVTRADDDSKVWVVNTGGGIGAHAKSEATAAGGDRPMHVRCVRGNSALGAGPRLRDNGDGTVTDQATGLIWQRVGVTEGMTWEAALESCTKLTLAGQGNWRLPNIKELRSVSMDSKVRPSLDTAFFPNAKAETYWSSTTQSNRPERAWFVDFATGLVSYSDKTEKQLVLAVRDDQSTAASKSKPVPDPKLLQPSKARPKAPRSSR